MRRLLTYGTAIAFLGFGQKGGLCAETTMTQDKAEESTNDLEKTLSIESYVKYYFATRPEIIKAQYERELVDTELKAAGEKWQSHVVIEPYTSREDVTYSEDSVSSKRTGFAAKTRLSLDHASGTSAYGELIEVLADSKEKNATVTRKDYQIGISQELNQNSLGQKQKVNEELWGLATQREVLQQQKTSLTLCTRGMYLFNEAYYLHEVAASYREIESHIKIVHDKMRRDFTKALIPQSTFLSIQNDYISAQSSAFKAKQRLKEFIPRLGLATSFNNIDNPDHWYAQINRKMGKNQDDVLDIKIKELEVSENKQKTVLAKLAQRSQVKLFSEIHQTVGDLPGEETWRSQKIVLGIRAVLPLKDPGSIKETQQALIHEKSSGADLLVSRKNLREAQSIIYEKLEGFSGEEALAVKEMETSHALVKELQKLLKSYRVGLADYRQARDDYIMKKIALLNVRKNKWDTITESIALNGTEKNICL